MKLTEARLRQIIREELGQKRPLSKDEVEAAYDQTVFDGLKGVDRVRWVAQKLGRNFAAEKVVRDAPIGSVQLTIVGPDGDLEVLSSAGRYDEDLDAFGEELKATLQQYGVDFVIRLGVTWDIVVPREAYIRKYVEGLPE